MINNQQIEEDEEAVSTSTSSCTLKRKEGSSQKNDKDERKTKTKKKAYKQQFCKKWLTCPELKEWLCEDKNSEKAYCKFCRQTISPKWSVIQSHMKSTLHTKNAHPSSFKRVLEKLAHSMETFIGLTPKGIFPPISEYTL